MKTGTYGAGRSARLAANPSGAVYGTIVATSVTAAAGAHHEPPGRIAAANVLTLLVFWLAHVYSELLEQRLRDGGIHLATVRAAMVAELAMIEAPALSVLFLALGAFGVLGDRLAVDLALANGVAQLLIWGVLVARRLGWGWLSSIAAGLVDGGFGVVLVGLEAVLH